eukprot:3711872-Rhodomonas_salina.2
MAEEGGLYLVRVYPTGACCTGTALGAGVCYPGRDELRVPVAVLRAEAVTARLLCETADACRRCAGEVHVRV